MKRLTLIISLLFCFLATYSQQNFYQDKLAEFSRMRPVDSTDVVMIGDEFMEYAGDWNVLLKWRHIRNRGIAGDDINSLSLRMNSILRGKPKMIFVMIGSRDIIDGMPAETLLSKYGQLLRKIRRQSPTTKIYVQSVLPVNESYGNDKLNGKMHAVALFDRRLRIYCKRNNYAYINLFKSFIRRGTNELRRELTKDGYNLSPFGYKIWAFELKKYLVQ